MIYLVFAVLSAVVLLGISMLSKVKSAVAGNLVSLCAMTAAIAVTLYTEDSFTMVSLWAAMAVGAVAGIVWAQRIQMIEMPQVVGALNGVGGLASAMVGAIELARAGSNVFANVTAALALVIGGVTFSGSMVAALKLARVLDSRPVKIKGYETLSVVLVGGMLLSIVISAFAGMNVIALVVGTVASLVFGVLFAMRVGGADMPVAISLLNSFSGIAGSIAGMAIYNVLLVCVGGIVGSSGLLLTQIMCRAMNRKLNEILLGKTVQAKASGADAGEASTQETAEEEEDDSAPEEAFSLRDAKDIIIVPGYGMAISQAQHKVRELTEKLEANGAKVRFAIHPVAGRMPGHMNVLLCEADVDYEYLYELDAINDDFENADAAIVIGASDVINPAAREAEGTPIYGMPILNVDKAKHIVICNYDLKPGYAGVENPIYTKKRGVTLVLGDAKDSIQKLIDELAATV